MKYKFDQLVNNTVSAYLREGIINTPYSTTNPNVPQAPRLIVTKRDLMQGGQTIKAGTVLQVLKSDSASYHAQPQQVTPNQPNPLGQPISIALADADPVVDQKNKPSNASATTTPPTNTPNAQPQTTESEETIDESVKIYTQQLEKYR